MLRLLRDSGTPGQKIEAGYLCTRSKIRRIDISSRPKGLRFLSSWVPLGGSPKFVKS